VQAEPTVVLAEMVDLEVVNHIQEMVDLEVLEEQNQEQIQHLKEILPRIIKVVEIVINVAAAVEQILIPPHYHSRKDLQVLLYLG
jgi:Asp-tRNA(Asn)/Glu-tRNA(Gln) amidotransferase C subunit